MLYMHNEIIRELEYIVFDEVHYINDADRGVVWEEVLILLPETVKLVLLSATVPNVKEFASWIGKTKQQKIYICRTCYRPTPLQYNLYIQQDASKTTKFKKSNTIDDSSSKSEFHVSRKTIEQNPANQQSEENHIFTPFYNSSNKSSFNSAAFNKAKKKHEALVAESNLFTAVFVNFLFTFFVNAAKIF